MKNDPLNSKINGGKAPKHLLLKRELGVPGATMMGLGSMIGTGVFVSIGIAAGVAGPAVVISIVIAAVVATCNALNSAQLAANHPVAGGTYAYGYKWMNSYFGFTAGFMFLLAKSASAATAALGFAGYLLFSFGGGNPRLIVPLAVGVVVALTLITMSGIRHSSRFNVGVVSVALVALLFFVAAASFTVSSENFVPFFSSPAESHDHPFAAVLQASALMFVAYTGYGRIVTLGEEVREPKKTIPRAIVVTLAVTALLYIGVAVVGIGSVGADAFYGTTGERLAPLDLVARQVGIPGAHWVIAVGALAAMLGVLINLLLGLSRMAMALGRRRDLPAVFARLNAARTTPSVAVGAVGMLIAGLALIGDVRVTWSFSAFTVLIYYAITNLAALRLRPEERMFPAAVAWAGLAGCLFLAFWVAWEVLLAGLLLIGAGLAWHALCRWYRQT